MTKLFFLISFLCLSQTSIAQVAQYNTLYLLFEPDSTQTMSVQEKMTDFPMENLNGTYRNENAYSCRAIMGNDGFFEIQNFYPLSFTSIDRTQALVINMNELSNYPVKTVDQLRAEANPTNAWYFTNHAFFDPIRNYYIVEKNIPLAGKATITKVQISPFVTDEH